MLVKHEIAFSVVSPITVVVGSNTKAAAYVFSSSSPAAEGAAADEQKVRIVIK